MITRIDQQRGIFGSRMRPTLPAEIWPDFGERAIGKRLHPPHARSGVQHYALPASRALDPALNRVDSVRRTLSGGGEFGELDNRHNVAAARAASSRHDRKESNQNNSCSSF